MVVTHHPDRLARRWIEIAAPAWTLCRSAGEFMITRQRLPDSSASGSYRLSKDGLQLSDVITIVYVLHAALHG